MKKYVLSLLVAAVLLGCEQSDPVFYNRTGDILTFAGREWQIKKFENQVWGPGPNYFTTHPNDVFVDDKGYLHLAVSQRENRWRSTEVYSLDTFGYGTYVWTIEGNPNDIDPNIVLGLFTWDDYTFTTDGNSEVDIEFSKWGDANEEFTLQYGVQPIAFGPYNSERVNKPNDAAVNKEWVGISTHAFTWTDSLITWQSWPGDKYGAGTPSASWTFDLSNPAKIKYEGNEQSDPIVIPAPGNNTNARMNLWLVNGPEGPSNGMRHEIIIRDFQYIP